MISDMEFDTNVDWEDGSPGRLVIDIPEEEPICPTYGDIDTDVENGYLNESSCCLTDFIPDVHIQSSTYAIEQHRDHLLLIKNHAPENEEIEKKISYEQLSPIDVHSFVNQLPSLSAIESKISHKDQQATAFKRPSIVDKRTCDENSFPFDVIPLESVIKCKVPVPPTTRKYTKKFTPFQKIQRESQQKMIKLSSRQKQTKRGSRKKWTKKECKQKQAIGVEIEQEQVRRAEIEQEQARRVEIQLEQIRLQIEQEQGRRVEIQQELRIEEIQLEHAKRIDIQLEQIQREIQQEQTNISNSQSSHNIELDKNFSNFNPLTKEIDVNSVFCFHCSASIQKHSWINHKSKDYHIMNVVFKESEIFAKFCFTLNKVANFESSLELMTELQGLFGNLIEITEYSLSLILSWLIKAVTTLILNLVKNTFFSISVDHFSKLLIIRAFRGNRICDYFLPGYFACEINICYLNFLQTYDIHNNIFVVAFNMHPCLNCVVTQRHRYLSNINIMPLLKPTFANIAFWLKTSKHMKNYCSFLDTICFLYKKYSEYFSLVQNSQILNIPLYLNLNLFVFIVKNKCLLQQICYQIYLQHCCFVALGITKYNFEFSKAQEVTIHLLSFVKACEVQNYKNLSMNNELLKTLNDIIPTSSSSRSWIESPTQSINMEIKFGQMVHFADTPIHSYQQSLQPSCGQQTPLQQSFVQQQPVCEQKQPIQSSCAQQQPLHHSRVHQPKNIQGYWLGQQLDMGNQLNGVPLPFPYPSYTPPDNKLHPINFSPDHESLTEVQTIVDLYLQEMRSPIYLNNRLTYNDIKFLFDLKNLENALMINKNIQTLIILFHKFMISDPFLKLQKFLTSFAIDVQSVTLRFPKVQGIIDSLYSRLKDKDYSVCLNRFYHCLATLPIYPIDNKPIRIPDLKIANCVLKKRFGSLLSPLLLGCMVACPSSQAHLDDIRNTMFSQFNEHYQV